MGEVIDQLFSVWKGEGPCDFETLEWRIRDSVHRCGSRVLERVFESEAGAWLDRTCQCGGTLRNRKFQAKTVVTVLGPIRLKRARQQCDRCGQWRVREDESLDVERTQFSPGVRRMMAKTGAEVCFATARDLIGELAGVAVTEKAVERVAEGIGNDIGKKEEPLLPTAMVGYPPETDEAVSTLYMAMDGTGIPVLRKETQGRKGKSSDGIARTREVKLGVVFTQTGTDQQGKPVRDPDATSYVGKIESADMFGPRLYSEACRRGLHNAGNTVVLGDGAPWIWNLADEYFPGAVQIVDYYHAKEHLGDVSKTLHPSDARARNQWMDRMTKILWDGDVCGLIDRLRSWRARGHEKAAIDTTIGYFEKNRQRMRYRVFRRAGFFIGSGVVEAGCKAVIGKRLKQSGMHWSVRGANAIIALRCHIESRRFDDYWKNRRAA
jgi:hypothetical protein